MHLGQPPEGSIGQLADIVSLKLQHLQTVKPLEREAFNQPDTIPIKVPEDIKLVSSECLHTHLTYNHSHTVPAGFLRQQGKSQ